MMKSEEKSEPKAVEKAEAKVEPKHESKLESAPKAENTGQAILALLEAATKGLLYTSETDAPLTPFFWPSDAKR